ncbi:MAG TPA: DUF3592 domain-containing protein [Spirochaetota bacterium]|mgnify:FL=1|jgi:hypothetical protein|nr:MAG: hypothetical protein BWX91_01229 [Spirochaetes bacterium ADurb.Bin133]HNZ26861.1 DUF3592 domain-containing protein [Spirochaetota bacterium]HPY88990.1 DUF3592 domain-containing protein [Spirochaetota bacterium]HQB62634.1 DUF3592 domain-containing protein [Spirochaetota bacterium]
MNAKNLLIIGLFISISGAVFIFVTLSNFFREKKFMSEGIVADAVVYERFTSRTSKEVSFNYWLKVKYLDQTEREFELSSEVPKNFWDEHPENSIVKIRYLKSDPNKSNILGAFPYKANFSTHITISIVAIIVGITMILIGIKTKN